MEKFPKGDWALILGGSSGFGLATAKKLSLHGMNIFVVHRDRRGSMTAIEKEFDEIKKTGVRFAAMNTNALTTEGRQSVIQALQEQLGGQGRARLLLHSIALGNLKLIAPERKESSAQIALVKLSEKLGVAKEKVSSVIGELLDQGISELHSLVDSEYGQILMDEEDMAQTIYNMGTSLLSWVQDLHRNGLFKQDARVIGLTSEGNQAVWKGYAAVSAAKVALEAVSRAIAVEFAPYGIRSNILQPGVTATPALKLIPGSDHMLAVAKMRNPFKRTTTPQDVADVIALLCTDEAKWINGTIIRVDGGEQISSF